LVHSGLSGDLSIIEDDDYVINVCETIETQYEEDAFNYMVSGDIHYMPKQDFDKQIIVGHLPTFKINNKPRILYGKNCIDIDCGASYSKGRLGCLRLDDMKEFYVPIDKRDV
jgi:serine/threonine protein phosphatase 1